MTTDNESNCIKKLQLDSMKVYWMISRKKRFHIWITSDGAHIWFKRLMLEYVMLY
jgi:hypothetical protein